MPSLRMIQARSLNTLAGLLEVRVGLLALCSSALRTCCNDGIDTYLQTAPRLIKPLRESGWVIRRYADALNVRICDGSGVPQTPDTSQDWHAATLDDKQRWRRTYDTILEAWSIVGADLADAAEMDLEDAREFIGQKMSELLPLLARLQALSRALQSSQR